MNLTEAKELHNLLFAFFGMFHEKFIYRFRHDYVGLQGLKKNQIKILNVLSQYDLLTLTEIGKMLDIEKGSLTALIDQMEEMELVRRCGDPEDRRKYLITLGVQGREEMERLIDSYAHKLIRLFENFDTEETKKFVASLENAVDFMKKV